MQLRHTTSSKMDPVYRWPSGPTALRTSSTFSAMRSKLPFPQHQSCHRKRTLWRNDQPLYPNSCSTRWGTWHVTFTGQSQSDSNYLRKFKSCLSKLYCQLLTVVLLGRIYLGIHLNPFGDIFHAFLDPGWPVSPPDPRKSQGWRPDPKRHPHPSAGRFGQTSPCHPGLTLGCHDVNLYVSQHPNLCSWWVKFRD